MSRDTFYTSVAQHFDKILVRGYRNGQPFKEQVDYQPTLYIEADSETEYTDITGDAYLRPKRFESHGELKQYLKTMNGVHGFRYYGTDNIVRQYISETYRGEIDWHPETFNVWFFDIETKVGEGIAYHEVQSLQKYKDTPSNHVWLESGTSVDVNSIDHSAVVWDHLKDEYIPFNQSCYANKGFPTPEYAYEEITLITLYNAKINKGFILSTLPIKENNMAILEGANYKFYDTEAEMLSALIKFFQVAQIDVLSGWNSEFFDIPYIVNRCRRVLGESTTNLLSPWKKISERRVKVNDKDVITFDLVGICHLDYLELYRKFNPGSQESFKLDYIADMELGYGKVDNPYDTFKEFYQNDSCLFVEYNWKDVTLLRDLEKKMQLVTTATMIAFMAKVNIDSVHSSMAVWESVIYNHFMERNQFAWLNAPKKPARSIPGAYVHTPVPGRRKWAVSVDATSLYPSIMMQNNISPDTKAGKLDVTPEDILSGNIPEFDKEQYIMSGNGVLTRKDKEGYIPFLVKQKFDQRKAFKKQMLVYETEAQAIRDELKKRGV